MYAARYNLNQLPFEELSDPKFIWLGEKHLKALSDFKYAMHTEKDFFLFTGDVGTGKTALIKRFLAEIDSKKIVASVSYPDLDKLSFFNYLSEEFKMGTVFDTKRAFYVRFKKFLLDAYRKNTRVILIIDEAHKINQEILEEILLFSIIRKDDKKLIDIILAGWREFRNELPAKYHKAFEHRVAFTLHLEPLSENETSKLILHRLRAAGSKTEIFTSEAFSEIYRFSAGYPRLVTNICDLALLTGYAREKNHIDKDLIIDCARELNITRNEVEKDLENIEYFYKDKENEVNGSDKIYEEVEKPLKGYSVSKKAPKFRKIMTQAFFAISLLIFGYLLHSLINFWLLPVKKPSQLQEPSRGLKNELAESFKEKRQEKVEENLPSQTKGSEGSGISPKKEAGEFNADDRKEAFRAETDKEKSVSQNQNKPSSKKFPEDGYANDHNAQSDVAESAAPTFLASKQLASPPSEVKTSEQILAKKKAEPVRPPPSLAETQKFSNLVSKEKVVKFPSSGYESVPKPKDRSKSSADIAPHQPEVSEIIKKDADRKLEPPISAQAQKTVSKQSIQQDLISPPELKPAVKTETKSQPEIARLEPETLDSDADHRLALKKRLQSFLQNYCRTYAARNLDKFMTFFALNAKENGKPISDLWPKYRRNFESNDQINYRIELQEYSYDDSFKTVNIEGRFFLRWLPRGSGWRENSGKIFMVLKGFDTSYQVARLDYYGDFQRKTQ